MNTIPTVLITGGATGIGAATVRKFVDEGWNVALIDINVSEAEALCRRLGGPESLLCLQADTRSLPALQGAVSKTMSRYGRLDCVFANAGIHRRNTIFDITDAELDLLIDVNIRGTVNTVRATIDALAAGGGGAIIINCSDQWFVGKCGNFGYGLTKGALGQITRSLALELGPKGIRVNAVCPSTIATPLVDNIFSTYAASHPDTTVAEQWADEDALFIRGKAGRPDEVADMVYYLAGAQFCTGGHYPIDGGLTAE
ncbi:MAG: SDR family NAD(P)-dependent oxidoreductase [Muribaculaceae bacterium]